MALGLKLELELMLKLFYILFLSSLFYSLWYTLAGWETNNYGQLLYIVITMCLLIGLITQPS